MFTFQGTQLTNVNINQLQTRLIPALFVSVTELTHKFMTSSSAAQQTRQVYDFTSAAVHLINGILGQNDELL